MKNTFYVILGMACVLWIGYLLSNVPEKGFDYALTASILSGLCGFLFGEIAITSLKDESHD